MTSHFFRKHEYFFSYADDPLLRVFVNVSVIFVLSHVELSVAFKQTMNVQTKICGCRSKSKSTDKDNSASIVKFTTATVIFTNDDGITN